MCPGSGLGFWLDFLPLHLSIPVLDFRRQVNQQSFQFADKLKPQPQHLSGLSGGIWGSAGARTCLSLGERAADTKNQLQ